MSSRREAIFILTRWQETGDFPDRLLPDSPDRAFITDLVFTAVRRRRSLLWALEPLLQKMPSGETGAALVLGASQILFMPDVADYAAVNETVEAAKAASRQTAGLVNGVLRNLLRRRDAVLKELALQPLGVRSSHPDALVTRWQARYGQAEAEALCDWNNLPAETFVACPPGTPPPPALALSPLTPNYYAVPRGTRVDALPGYAEGAFIVQDPATAAAVDLLDVRPGQAVLDACAAPGGKTVQLAWRMGAPASERHRLVALDLHADRLERVRANLARTRQDWVTVVQGDLTDPACEALAPFGLFDRILLDAPCSNTGVLRRRPDARWRWTTKRMKALAAAQAAMLEACLARLAPGGRLVYSTCSLEPEENRRQVTLLRKAHPEVACIGVDERVPTRSRTDGAFACALERTQAGG
jgi:16S rRNA (cytosine967-C5)-methyltransferase